MKEVLLAKKAQSSMTMSAANQFHPPCHAMLWARWCWLEPAGGGQWVPRPQSELKQRGVSKGLGKRGRLHGVFQQSTFASILNYLSSSIFSSSLLGRLTGQGVRFLNTGKPWAELHTYLMKDSSRPTTTPGSADSSQPPITEKMSSRGRSCLKIRPFITYVSTDRWMEKDVVRIYDGILLSHRKNEIMPFAPWRDIEMTTLSEVSQTKTNIIDYHLYMESKIWHKWTYPQNGKRLPDI